MAANYPSRDADRMRIPFLAAARKARSSVTFFSFLRTLPRCLRAGAVFCGAGLVFAAGAAQAAPAGESASPACPPAAVMPDLSRDGLAAAMQRAVDRGILWRIDKDGHSSWLYGTLHLGEADWMFPGPTVRRAMAESDTVALELDPLDPATQAAFAAPIDEAAAARVLTPERRRRLDRQAARACVPEATLARMPPVLQATTLALLSARTDGLYAQFGSEAFLSGLARGRGKPVVALETAAAQWKALIGGSEADQGEQVDAALDELEAGQSAAKTSELAQAWAHSDGSKLDRYAQWCGCMDTAADRRMLRRLLDDRNPHLADGIARLHAEGQRVFGAVGALHMIGPLGLPALMAARGFRVTRMLPRP
ncbi:TraB family protein [Variovorax sp. PBL-E5]|nr:TraB family protein [Variovorax sp. PBL-E5]